MRKILALMLAGAMSLSLAACGGSTDTPESSAPASDAPASSTAPEAAPEAAPAADGQYEIAMITDIGSIDDKSFNQGTWEGVKAYAEANGKTHQYYKPTEKSTDAYLSSIAMAIENGAKVVVTPGFLFEEPIAIAQDQYPDTTFILIDAFPAKDGETVIAKNTVGIVYAEEQSGFLAGYAAVKDGNTNLAFMGGMAVPAVVKFGYGFVQGAEAAAQELGLTGLQMKYHYTGSFDATPEAKALAAGWYQDGTQVIFACGGAVGNSVMAAAEEKTGKVIGVDVDQYAESETVITSAMKGLAESVTQMLGRFYDGSFPGGEGLTLTAKEKGVQISMENAKFEKFSQADYDAIYAKLSDGSVTLINDVEKAVTDLGTSAVTVTVIQ